MATAAARARTETFAPTNKLRLVEATFDPFENDMGEGSLQRFISEMLRPLIERLLRERGMPTFVGADQYVGWHPHDPKKVVAPDVYVLPGVTPGEEFDFWKVWQTDIVPSFALEIVSKRKPKDYVDAPARYADLGVEELVVFDPRPRRNGSRWQVYRKVAGRGLVKVETTNDDRVRSAVLGCWLRAVGIGKHLRVRLALDPRGEELLPTAEEAERANAEAERARADAERGARERAEAEIARLRAELAQRGPPGAGGRARTRRAR